MTVPDLPPRCRVELPDSDATEWAGARLAPVLPASATVFLQGELGAGKTTLVRAVLRALGHRGPVPSPTYTLVEIYETPTRTVQHFDLYRLADPEEFEFIGGHDLLAERAVRFIEWPARASGELPRPDVLLRLDMAGCGRRLTLCADSDELSDQLCKVLKR